MKFTSNFIFFQGILRKIGTGHFTFKIFSNIINLTEQTLNQITIMMLFSSIAALLKFNSFHNL